MRVIEIWRFPVKSMGGEVLPWADVGELGITGDRGWSVFDVETGTTLTARRTPELLFASARIESDHLVVRLPDGSEIGGADHAAMSTWLGRDVELRAARDDGRCEGGTYECPIDFENDDEWVAWTGPAGAYHDSDRTRVSLVSTASIGTWDRRRFRTNVVVDGSGEDELVDGAVTIGSVDLDVTKRVDRCVMVTRPQPGVERDLDVLRTINRERDSYLAVGCLVTRGGRIAVGDAVVR